MKPEDMTVEIDGKTMYKCPLCGKLYKKPQNMVQHLGHETGCETKEHFQELYDKLFLNGVRPVCKFHDCKNHATFKSFMQGYSDCCNRGHAAAYSNFIKRGQWSTLHNPEVEEKVRKVWSEKYGGHPMKDPSVRSKMEETCMKTYGCKNANQNESVKLKAIRTNLANRGVPYVLQDPELRKKINIINRQKNAEKLYKDFLVNVESRNYEPLFTFEEFLEYKPLKLKCKKCGKIDTIDIPSNLSICCITHGKPTEIEVIIDEILKSINVDYRFRDRQHLDRKEIDFFIPSKMIGIECNGGYFHSDSVLGSDKYYHINKTNEALQNGITLLQFWEDEIKHKSFIIKSMIKGKLGIYESSYRASKLRFSPVNHADGKTFMDANHIQGHALAKGGYYGLLDENNNIVCCAQIGDKRVIYKGTKDETVSELIRFATKLGTNVYGGFSKILKHVIPLLKMSGKTSIETFCDRRFSPDASKTVYAKTGFTLIDSAPEPSYWYYDKISTKHRYAYTKSILVEKFGDVIDNIKDKTEFEITDELGFFRLWDCGQFKFTLKL